ncbi:MAG TPA: DJ-1/PfpI family protein [Nitrososphaerales archaeon]|nr:DJ-1/PfpI family protein [Nitrososphaerales archaeon]
MKVALLVFSGVEELDLVGFLEVLAVANRVIGLKEFDMRLVSLDPGPVECSGGLKILPTSSLTDLKGADVVFVPGGGAGRGTGVDPLLDDAAILESLRNAFSEGKMVWSVCTGALVLGKAGLLKGRKATTHHAYLKKLKNYGAKVQENQRVVVDGRITTGGGISSSVDVGLELVRRTLGPRIASEVGRRMEYPSKKQR